MNMRSVFFSAVSIVSLVLASCGTGGWSDSDKIGMSSLAVPPAGIKAGAYQTPIGSARFAAPIITTGTGNFATGAAAGAVGQLAVEIGAAIDQRNFESRYADAIQRAPGTVPGDLGTRIRKAVTKTLGTHSFLKGKISDTSPNRFVITVESYRYVRAGGADGEVLVTPAIFGKFELNGSGGKQLLSRNFTAAGSTKRPLNAFASDKALASRAFDEAVSRVALQAYNSISGKLGEVELDENSVTPDAAGGGPLQLEGIGNLSASCSYPYKLTRDCNAFTGAGRKISVRGQNLKIAGSSEGKVILIRDASLIPRNSVSSTGSPQYNAVREALRAAGVKILRQRDLINPGNKAGGFYLELDGDGYSILTRAN